MSSPKSALRNEYYIVGTYQRKNTFTCTACEAGSGGVIEESMDKTHNVSTYVPPTTNEYEIIIGASQMGGEIVSDGCGYTYHLVSLVIHPS